MNISIFNKIIFKKVTLYTLYSFAKSIIMENLNKIVKQTPTDSPIAIQIATNCENDAAKAIEILENKFNFDEYNLNIGCPSSLAVKQANCGACLVPNTNSSSKNSTSYEKNTNKPVSIKNRIGIRDNEENMVRKLTQSLNNL